VVVKSTIQDASIENENKSQNMMLLLRLYMLLLHAVELQIVQIARTAFGLQTKEKKLKRPKLRPLEFHLITVFS
jgi:hypothetical protein